MSQSAASVRLPARLGWRLALTLAATCALVAALLHDAGASFEFFAALRNARGGWVALAFSIACACVLLGVVRWQIVLSAMRRPLGFARALQAILATWPLAVVTPSRTNELLRAAVVRDAVPLAAGTGSILAEKAIDLFVLLVLAASGAVLRALWLWAAIAIALSVAELGVIVVLFTGRPWLERLPFARRRPEKLAELLAAFESLRRAPGRLAALAIVSLAVRVMTVAVTHSLLVAVGVEVRPMDTLTLWPLAMLVGVAPVTIAGMGTRDAAFIYLLEAHGVRVAPAAVLAATMGYSVVAIWSFAIIGLPFMMRALLHLPRKARGV